MDHAKPRNLPFHLLEEMTNGFADDRKLGSGAYGKVYMGNDKSGKKIAVKMLNDMPGLDDEQFEKEYHNLASLQHQNIVQLVGYCYETRGEYVSYNDETVLAGRTKRALCFEYMKNGSLDSCLSDESCGQDWHTRYSIIKGICKGLKYLHEELESPMYHLDLKPGNILLDEKMVPKVADFGLSRLFGGEEKQSTKGSVGTHGYIPPEYIDEGVISIKFDIFSLGVVILKIIAGAKGYFKSAEMTSQQFIDLVLKNWRSRLQAISLYALESSSEQIKRCIEIALKCVEADRHKRPSIGDIVNKLNEADSMIQICPCICSEDELLDVLPNKLISYTHDVTDSTGKAHEVTLTTNCDTTGETATVDPIPPGIKIITLGDGLGRILSIDVHPTEPWILVGHRSGYVSIWNYQTQAKVVALDITNEQGLLDYLLGITGPWLGGIFTAKFIPRKQLFVAGDQNGYMHVHTCMTMDKLMKIQAHRRCVTSLTVHPSQPFVLSGSDNDLIKLWNWEAGWACIQQFDEKVDSNIRLSPQTASNTFASVSFDGVIKIWSLFSAIPIATFDHRSVDNMHCVDYFPVGGGRLYMVTESAWRGNARIWDLETNTCIRVITGLRCNGFAVLDPLSDHPIFITASAHNVVSLCNSTTHRYENRVDFKLGDVIDYAYLTDVRSVAVGFENAIGIMEIRDGKEKVEEHPKCNSTPILTPPRYLGCPFL